MGKVGSSALGAEHKQLRISKTVPLTSHAHVTVVAMLRAK